MSLSASRLGPVLAQTAYERGVENQRQAGGFSIEPPTWGNLPSGAKQRQIHLWTGIAEDIINEIKNNIIITVHPNDVELESEFVQGISITTPTPSPGSPLIVSLNPAASMVIDKKVTGTIKGEDGRVN